MQKSFIVIMMMEISDIMLINGPAGQLELAIDKIDANSAEKWAVICHPHPLFGGTMTNKVVTTTAKALQQRAYHTVRFNFRGIGKSTGTFDEGRGELDDLLAVLTWLKDNYQIHEVCLAGFSFGSYIALQGSLRWPCTQLITIAPPIMRFDYSKAQQVSCPWLLIQGEDDDVVNPLTVITWADALAKTKKNLCLIRMPNAGHFFHGKLIELRELIAHHLTAEPST